MNARLRLTLDPAPRARWLFPVLAAALTVSACSGEIGDVDGTGSGSTKAGGPATGTGPGGSSAGTSTGTGGTSGGTGTSTGTGMGTGSGGGQPVAQPASVLAPSSRFARLSLVQWANSAKDLLKLSDLGGIEATITGDALLNFDNEGDALRVGDTVRTDFQRVSEALATKVTGDAASLARIVPANAPTAASEKAKAFITAFGLHAYRRPLTTAEVDEAVLLFNKGPTLYPGGDAFAAGANLVIQFFLQSPHFLYRSELSTAVVDGKIPLSPYEIASKVSYALTNSMPDDQLLDLAAKGMLKSADDVAAQAKRLVATPAGVKSLEHFHFQVLKVGGYSGITKSEKLFPKFTPAVRDALSQETMRFTDWIFDQGKGVKDLFTDSTTFVNSALAPIYGLSGQFGTDFKQVTLDKSARAGLLTQLGYLSLQAHEEEIDSIHRGVFVLQRVLCMSIQPPNNVTITPVPPPSDTLKTNRQRVWAHTGPGTCGAGCHGTLIDPAGFAFEGFDPIGMARTMDNGEPIDSTGDFDLTVNGELKKVHFNNAIDFSKALVTSETTHECYATNWMSYLFGRNVDLEDPDAPTTDLQEVQYLGQESLAGRPIKDIVMSLVSTDQFVARLPGGN